MKFKPKTLADCSKSPHVVYLQAKQLDTIGCSPKVKPKRSLQEKSVDNVPNWVHGKLVNFHVKTTESFSPCTLVLFLLSLPLT